MGMSSPAGRSASRLNSGAADEPAHEAAHATRAGLPRAHHGRQLGPLEDPAAEHRGGVADPGHHEGKEDEGRPGPVLHAVAVVPQDDKEARQEPGVHHAEHGDGHCRQGLFLRRAFPQRPGQDQHQPDRPAVEAEHQHPPGVVHGGKRQVAQRPEGQDRQEADFGGRLDPLAPGQVEHLPGPQHGHHGHDDGQEPAPVPDEAQREGNSHDGKRHPADEVGVHQAGTRPNRRSRC